MTLGEKASKNPSLFTKDIFDFELDAEDRECIAELPKRERQINPSFAPEWDKE